MHLVRHMNRATFDLKSPQCRIIRLPLPLQIDSAAPKAQVKRRSFHAPNQIQLSVAVERHWSDVESNVAPNMPLQIETESKELRRSNSAK